MTDTLFDHSDALSLEQEERIERATEAFWQHRLTPLQKRKLSKQRELLYLTARKTQDGSYQRVSLTRAILNH